MYCIECGAKVDEAQIKCLKCGAEQPLNVFKNLNTELASSNNIASTLNEINGVLKVIASGTHEDRITQIKSLSNPLKIIIGVCLLSVSFLFLFSMNYIISPSIMTEALDPFTGNNEKSKKWQDIGGLDSKNGDNFFGVHMISVSAAFASGNESNRLKRLSGTVSPEESPQNIRKALAKACRVSESDFERIEYLAVPAAKVKNGDLTCHYEDHYISIFRGNGL